MSLMIDCRNVIKIYYNRTKQIKMAALRGVELKVKKGELVAIVGPSGAGKSTLLKILGALDFPSSGTLHVGGKLVNTFTPSQIIDYHRNWVGFVWQSPLRNVLASEKAINNVLLPMKIGRKIAKSEQKKRALNLLESVGLEHRINHNPTQLSGGEIQRLGIATALANDPKILLLDEPTGELDSETTTEIFTLLKELNNYFDKTIVLVSHDRYLEKKADVVYRISDGLLLNIDLAKSLEVVDSKEQVSYVDEFGLLRIPLHFLKELGIQNYVKIKRTTDRIEILPHVQEEVISDILSEKSVTNKESKKKHLAKERSK
ncbi:MAG TPA: ABC transporter ATP-binding protein [candidate division Zixibacteria bacterium]|nr:ABC transporter ATP-binding protein [candidate division Zixibacteria bacterium]